MKFSFDFENYRKKLAEDLVKKRKDSREGAKNLLDEEKDTEKYQIAKRIKNINYIEKKVENEIKKEREREREVCIKIKTININNIIPEDLKIFFDQIRLEAIEEGLRKKIVRPKNAKSGKELHAILDSFVNEITEGDFLNPQRLNHVINAYTRGHKTNIHSGVNKTEILVNKGVASTPFFRQLVHSFCSRKAGGIAPAAS